MNRSASSCPGVVLSFMGCPAVMAEVVESRCCHGGVPACEKEAERAAA